MTALAAVPVGDDPVTLHVVERPANVVRQALRMRRTQVGVVVAGTLVAIALFGPLVAPHGAREYVGSPNLRHAPSTLFGTDYFGQDVWSRFLHGGRSILVLALCATALGVGLGSLLGMTAAYLRGRSDELLMRTLDILLAFPQVLLSLVVIAMFSPSGLVVVLTVGLTTVPRVARIIRGAAVGVVERDFIGAAEAIGETRRRVEIGRAHV